MMLMDFHSHVLPGIDDGSEDTAQSLQMLRAEAEQGIGLVLATPHFYCRSEFPESFLERRDRAEEALRQAMAHHSGLPELRTGAEVLFFRGISESEFLPLLTIRGGRSILIEMPPAPWPDAVFRELETIWMRREIRPIIAHVDRYISPFRTFGIPERLSQLPVLVQANAEFFLNRSTAHMALKMLRSDQIQLLGSDCHNMTSRKPNLAAAAARIKKKLGEDALERISHYQCVALQE